MGFHDNVAGEVPQQSLGCEGSDDATLPRLTRLAMINATPRPSHCHEVNPLTPKGPDRLIDETRNVPMFMSPERNIDPVTYCFGISIPVNS
ncbi:hypothetical protein E2C01_070770 [Portunus trituberculatus]|uniref:Uncharacterized protein n=1 Tax=Portunus trituberculatus TaxID=210409 RepID=A0A5B7HV26_PORTR|nr:hypothetical protein [Portunus trituberculatus]